MTVSGFPNASSPISLSLYTGLRHRQVRNALRDVHPVPDPMPDYRHRTAPSNRWAWTTARPKDEQCESSAPKARSRFAGTNA